MSGSPDMIGQPRNGRTGAAFEILAILRARPRREVLLDGIGAAALFAGAALAFWAAALMGGGL